MRFSYPRRDTQSVQLFHSVWGIRFDDFGFKAYQPPREQWAVPLNSQEY